MGRTQDASNPASFAHCNALINSAHRSANPSSTALCSVFVYVCALLINVCAFDLGLGGHARGVRSLETYTQINVNVVVVVVAV